MDILKKIDENDVKINKLYEKHGLEKNKFKSELDKLMDIHNNLVFELIKWDRFLRFCRTGRYV